jgi:squalene-hopene/tetraprenyl-beta-curcumene cyclase
MPRYSITAVILSICGLIAFVFVRTPPVQGAATNAASTTTAVPWNRASAAHYLDQRETWWQNWPHAQKESGTVCISCHTQVPYALVRPSLRGDLHQSYISAPEQIMLNSVEKRVTNWSTMVPFYSDEKNGPGKTVEAHNTEAVLNAIILSSFDQKLGHLRPITVTAFDHAWALQDHDGPLVGSWKWQNFHLGPWEGDESGYQTSALLVLATHQAPDGYAHRPEVRQHLDQLTSYLQKNYSSQPLINQIYVLWASSVEPSLITPAQRQTLLTAMQQKQQADGGWNSFAIDPYERKGDSTAATSSDGYATAIAALALESSGKLTRETTKPLQQALQWLRSHQNSDGTWHAESINKHRDPDTAPALFMTDAATAYAVLALDQ